MLKTQIDWQPVKTMPKEGAFLVWLETPHKLMDTNIGVAKINPNVSFVNGMFRFDVSPITHWALMPDGPTN